MMLHPAGIGSGLPLHLSIMAVAPPMSPTSSLATVLFLVASLVAVAMADDGTTHLHFFMHDTVTGSDPTAVPVIKGNGSSVVPGLAFGDTIVIDDALTTTTSASSSAAVVGRAQGYYMMSSQSAPAVLSVCANLLLTTGEFNGSTVAVMGRDDISADVRELAVVGGTGRFRMATGYVLWKTASMNGPDAIIELDVYVKTTTSSSTAAGDCVGGCGVNTSGVQRMGAAGWVNACVVALVVAVVGSSCVW